MSSYVWYSWLLLLLGSYAARLTFIYFYNRPRGTMIVGIPTVFGKWLTSMRCLFMAPHILTTAHAKANGKAFAIPNLSGYQVCLSEANQVNELGKASVQHLSFVDVLNEAVFPRSTMRGFQFSSSDPYNKATVLPVKSGMRSQLPRMGVGLEKALERAFDCVARGEKDRDGWTRVTTQSVRQLVGSLDCFVILGDKLSSDTTIAQAARQYTRDALRTAALLRMINPGILQNFIGSVTMRWSGACQKLEKAIFDVAEQRLSDTPKTSSAAQEPLDAVQWIINTSNGYCQPTATEIAQRVLGFLLGAASQLPMLVTFALYNLSKHPEYLQPLREELENRSYHDFYDTAARALPLLDSFLKETARHFPLVAVSTKRKVLRDFTFANGVHVPAGNYIGVSQQAIMLDPRNYENPSTFEGFRFASGTGDNLLSKSRFSHPGTVFPFWGSVSRPCPGRFYASMVAKMVLAHIIAHYDVKLADKNAEPSFSFGVNIIPRTSLTLLIRERTADTA